MCVANGTILRSAVPEKHLWQNSLRTFSPPTWVDNFSLHLTRILYSIWLHGPFNLWKSLFSGCQWYHGFRALFPSFFPSHSSSWVLTLGFSRAQSLVLFSSLGLSLCSAIHFEHLLNAHYVGIILSILYAESDLMITTCTKCRYYHYPHFTDEKQKLRECK